MHHRISCATLAASLRVPAGHLVQIVNGERSISAEMACRLGRYFRCPPLYWLGLQVDYDLMSVDEEQIEREVAICR